jgi:ABC-type arginine/histidine transport system permease subunit
MLKNRVMLFGQFVWTTLSFSLSLFVFLHLAQKTIKWKREWERVVQISCPIIRGTPLHFIKFV